MLAWWRDWDWKTKSLLVLTQSVSVIWWYLHLEEAMSFYDVTKLQAVLKCSGHKSSISTYHRLLQQWPNLILIYWFSDNYKSRLLYICREMTSFNCSWKYQHSAFNSFSLSHSCPKKCWTDGLMERWSAEIWIYNQTIFHNENSSSLESEIVAHTSWSSTSSYIEEQMTNFYRYLSSLHRAYFSFFRCSITLRVPRDHILYQ